MELFVCMAWDQIRTLVTVNIHVIYHLYICAVVSVGTCLKHFYGPRDLLRGELKDCTPPFRCISHGPDETASGRGRGRGRGRGLGEGLVEDVLEGFEGLEG